MRRHVICAFILLNVSASCSAYAATSGEIGKDGDWKGPIPEEFRIKRERVFEFAAKPTITRDGDKITISFATKGFCDVTIALEDEKGKIIRHLVSGVLGPNAPAPLQKNSKKQVVVWDGKNDQGIYVDDKDQLTVRVSLGLKPQFERTLLWSPHKQRGAMPFMAASPDGVYVFDGTGVDYLRMYDHDGNYLRTIHPFPAKKLKDVKGLRWVKFPQGPRLPIKESGYLHTFLNSGNNATIHSHGAARSGAAATGMAVKGSRIALARNFLNRLAVDGSSGGLVLKGPKTGFGIKRTGYGGFGGGSFTIGPTSLAFSPDAKTLYMTGYMWRQVSRHSGCIHVVLKMDFASNDEPAVFVGSKERAKFGKGNSELCVPTSVACDAKGNVYVSDFLNNRVQVFDAAAKHLKTISVKYPTKVLVHQKTGEIYVFSWQPIGIPGDAWRKYKYDAKRVKAGLTRFTAYPACKKTSFEAFPFGAAENNRIFNEGQQYNVELDSWAPGKDPTFWIMGRMFVATRADARYVYIDPRKVMDNNKWTSRGIRIMRKKKGKWAPEVNFGQRTAKAVKRVAPIKHNVQELFVNPVNGRLYVGEADSGPTGKAYNKLIEIRPDSGKIKYVHLPFNPEEMDFDQHGMAYLRTTDVIARYDSRTWREVPWDYGDQLPRVTCAMGGKIAPVLAGIRMPSKHPVCFHQGGMGVSAKGYVVAACSIRAEARKWHKDFAHLGVASDYGRKWVPPRYPGREESSTSCAVHIWDKHGKLVHEDVVMGTPQLDGVHIDRDNNIYLMAAPTRVINGKPYFNYMSETLMKFKPGKGKFIKSGKGCPVPVNPAGVPKRPKDVNGRWVEGAEWFYGGVGYAGFNTPHAGGGCACWYARFDLDYFARSFAPEMNLFSVAVLDSNGNLITRIGKYGNVDDGVPLVKDGGPEKPAPLGGDEVSLFHAGYVATHTDHRLFIADLGNARLLSVKLGYHATEKTALKNIPDLKK